MKIVEEFITAGRQRPDIDDDFAAGRDDLFHAQRNALEFHWCRVEIFHSDADRAIGGRAYLARLEAMILDCNRNAGALLRVGMLARKEEGGCEQCDCEESSHRPHRAAWKKIHLHEILLINRTAASELEFEQQSRALSGKICKIEPSANAGLVASDLRFPCGTHEHLGSDFPIESRTEIDSVAGK